MKLTFTTIIAVALIACTHANSVMEEEIPFDSILGTWDQIPETSSNSQWQLSWGVGEVVLHQSFAVEERQDTLIMIVPDYGIIEVQNFSHVGRSTYRVVVASRGSQLTGTYTIHFESSSAMWLEDKVWNPAVPELDPFIGRKGPHNVYYKRSGPDI